MTIQKILLASLMLSAAAWLVGCCNCGGPPGGVNIVNLPPPITVEQQVQLLNDRAAAIPFLHANIDNLEFRYYKNNQPKHDDADGGSLLIRQHLGGADAGDILLTGNFLAQPAIQLGKNEKVWWYANYIQKFYTINQVNQTPNFTGDFADIFRADLHLQMLALGQITADPDHVIAMEVDDLLGKNRIFIERNVNGFARVERQIIIDRFTGLVEEVDIYNNTGSLLARSRLSKYQPATYVGATPPANPPKIPTEINVDFPTLKSSVTIKLFNLNIVPSIPDSSFEPDNFQNQGLHLQQIDGS